MSAHIHIEEAIISCPQWVNSHPGILETVYQRTVLSLPNPLQWEV